MKITTGNFANVKKYKTAGYVPVSIALSARYFTGLVYRLLNPEWIYKDDPEISYTKKFNSKLEKLNPEQVYKDLEKLSNGRPVVLCCHENKDEFCHRHLVARWLEKKLNIVVEELGKMEKVKEELLFEPVGLA